MRSIILLAAAMLVGCDPGKPFVDQPGTVFQSPGSRHRQEMGEHKLMMEQIHALREEVRYLQYTLNRDCR